MSINLTTSSAQKHRVVAIVVVVVVVVVVAVVSVIGDVISVV